MKLFFKHLKNSIKRRPMQPLILILTLALVMVVITLILYYQSNIVFNIINPRIPANPFNDI